MASLQENEKRKQSLLKPSGKWEGKKNINSAPSSLLVGLQGWIYDDGIVRRRTKDRNETEMETRRTVYKRTAIKDLIATLQSSEYRNDKLKGLMFEVFTRGKKG